MSKPRFYYTDDTDFQKSRANERRLAFSLAIEQEMTETEREKTIKEIDYVTMFLRGLFQIPEWEARDMATDYVLILIMLPDPIGQEG